MLPIVPGDRRRSEGSGETFGQFPIARGCARYGPGRDVYGLRGRSKGAPVDFRGTQRAQGPLAETNSVVASGSLSHSERTHRSHQKLLWPQPLVPGLSSVVAMASCKLARQHCCGQRPLPGSEKMTRFEILE